MISFYCNKIIGDLLMKFAFERLLKHCFEVYSGKTVRNGMPYILHPLEVMIKVESLPEKNRGFGS